MNPKVVILYLFSIAFGTLFAQSSQDKQAQVYLDRIGIHQIGISVGASYWNNVHSDVMVLYALGTTRNIINLDVGIGYRLSIPLLNQVPPSFYGHYLPLLLNARCNFYRWNRSCTYLHATSEFNVNIGDQSVHQSFFSISGGVGIKHEALAMSIFYAYDLRPSFAQKYIYENPEFDFDSFRIVIYERMHLGARLTYYFTLGL